jgi:alpha-tubulin suppressor-like RCC1 family protein
MSILETLKSEVEARIAALTSTDAVEDMLVLTASLDSLTEDRMNTLELVDDLPEAYTVPEGTIFFVNEINTLVYSLTDRWLGIDGRVLRLDPITALAWGCNLNGRLGDGTVIEKSSPMTVIGGITNWSQVSAASNHSLGIANKIAYAWGNNGRGRLGDGTSTDRISPVTVVGGITDWKQLHGGFQHSLGLTENGITYAWGCNSLGQIGNGTTTSHSSPVTVVGGITNWSKVSTGGNHNLGLTNTNIAYAWGYNGNGRLGDGTVIDRSSPVTVVGGITNWSSVSVGNQHSLGLTDDGIAYAWGAGGNGRLGDGTVIDRSSPVTVVGGIANWSQVSAGTGHSLGVTDTGIAYAWGLGNNGRLGDNTIITRSSPVTVVGGIANWSQVSAGIFHSLGVTDTGIVYAWGYNLNGRLGDDTIIARSSPVTVAGGITTWTQISAGGYHSLALKTD